MKTKELKRKLKVYLRLENICEVALLAIVLSVLAWGLALEQDYISLGTAAVIFLAMVVVAAAVLLLKKFSDVQASNLMDRLDRREAWEESRDLSNLSKVELESDFRRYFGNSTVPQTVRTRMIERLPLLCEGDSVEDAVEEWLYRSGLPHIKQGGLTWFSDDGKTWKAAEPEVLKGEVIIFERVVREDA